MNRRGPRTEPCGTQQLSGYDWDDTYDILTEKERTVGLNSDNYKRRSWKHRHY